MLALEQVGLGRVDLELVGAGEPGAEVLGGVDLEDLVRVAGLVGQQGGAFELVERDLADVADRLLAVGARLDDHGRPVVADELELGRIAADQVHGHRGELVGVALHGVVHGRGREAGHVGVGVALDHDRVVAVAVVVGAEVGAGDHLDLLVADGHDRLAEVDLADRALPGLLGGEPRELGGGRGVGELGAGDDDDEREQDGGSHVSRTLKQIHVGPAGTPGPCVVNPCRALGTPKETRLHDPFCRFTSDWNHVVQEGSVLTELAESTSK